MKPVVRAAATSFPISTTATASSSAFATKSVFPSGDEREGIRRRAVGKRVGRGGSRAVGSQADRDLPDDPPRRHVDRRHAVTVRLRDEEKPGVARENGVGGMVVGRDDREDDAARRVEERHRRAPPVRHGQGPSVRREDRAVRVLSDGERRDDLPRREVDLHDVVREDPRGKEKPPVRRDREAGRERVLRAVPGRRDGDRRLRHELVPVDAEDVDFLLLRAGEVGAPAVGRERKAEPGAAGPGPSGGASPIRRRGAGATGPSPPSKRRRDGRPPARRRGRTGRRRPAPGVPSASAFVRSEAGSPPKGASRERRARQRRGRKGQGRRGRAAARRLMPRL